VVAPPWSVGGNSDAGPALVPEPALFICPARILSPLGIRCCDCISGGGSPPPTPYECSYSFLRHSYSWARLAKHDYDRHHERFMNGQTKVASSFRTFHNSQTVTKPIL